MLPSLDSLLTYSNPKLIKRYQQDYPNNRLPAEEVLIELLKYFWLCHKHKYDKENNLSNESLQFNCDIYPEMKEMDDMWHTFLLFSKDYMNFCLKNFEQFLHHNPTTENNISSTDEFAVQFKRYLSYIYDHLGEDTLIKWFDKSIV